VRFFEQFNRPAIVLTVLGLILIVNGFLYYRQQIATQGSEGSAQGDNETSEDVKSSTEPSGTEYLANVETIQNASVKTLVSSNDKLLRYDTLNARDVEDLESNQLTLADYRDQVGNLNAPKDYEAHYEAFSKGISELYEASNIAYLLAADPVSATQADFSSYNDHVELATTLLQQSNETLGQDYETTEGLKLPARPL
jgi:hypothetical protein